MSGPADEQVESAILGVDPLIRAMIRKRMHVSLSPGDSSRDNQDALELYSEIWVELYRRLRADPSAIQNPAHYAAATARNKFFDYVRERYPNRQSLANSLRYFLEEMKPDYDIWDAESEVWCGFSGWRAEVTARAKADRIAGLASDPQVLGGDVRRSRDTMKRKDWSKLLDAVFNYVEGPVEWDAFVALMGTILGVVDQPPAEIDVTLRTRDLSPYERARIRQALGRLWPEIVDLNFRWRASFLLNPPFGCDIDVFVEHGMTTVRAIGALFQFTGEQFETIWRELELSEEHRRQVQELESYQQRFCLLWLYLPIRDILIGLLIERTAQQVIALRRLARERLAERARGA